VGCVQACVSEWSLSTLPNPIPELQHPPLSLKVLWVKERAPIPLSSAIFYLDSHLNLSRNWECVTSPLLKSAWTIPVERAFGKPFARKQLNTRKQLNVINSGMCSSSPASKMNSAFIPSKPATLFLCNFSSAWSNSTSVIFVFRVWVGGGSVTWIEWSVRSRISDGDWPTSPRKPYESVAALILSTTGALGQYFF